MIPSPEEQATCHSFALVKWEGPGSDSKQIGVQPDVLGQAEYFIAILWA